MGCVKTSFGLCQNWVPKTEGFESIEQKSIQYSKGRPPTCEVCADWTRDRGVQGGNSGVWVGSNREGVAGTFCPTLKLGPAPSLPPFGRLGPTAALPPLGASAPVWKLEQGCHIPAGPVLALQPAGLLFSHPFCPPHTCWPLGVSVDQRPPTFTSGWILK